MRHLINCPRLVEESGIDQWQGIKVFLSKKDKVPYYLVSSENGMFLLKNQTETIRTNFFWVADPTRKEQKIAQYECAGYLVSGNTIAVISHNGIEFMPISVYEKEVLLCR